MGAALGLLHGAPSRLIAAGEAPQPISVVFAHTDVVSGLRFTPDGRYLASSSDATGPSRFGTLKKGSSSIG